jgi:hypothetical protein
MGKRVNITISDVQAERMEELCELHGHENVTQCVKYLVQRGLTIECSTAGILTTNDRLGEMLETMKTDVGGLVVPPQSPKFRNSTLPIEFENEGGQEL